MTRLMRLLRLFRPAWGWLALASLVALLALLANIALMGLSGWFIAAMGLAGASGAGLDYFTPASLIRAAAMLRSLGRYGERLLGHEATFRLLARLRVWLFTRLLPQSAQALGRLHSGDIASRLRRDIDRLETAHLRVLAPLLTALVGGGLMAAWLGRLSAALAWSEAALLALAGLAAPLLLAGITLPMSRRQITLASRLHETAVDGLQGLPDLLTSGDLDGFRARFAAHNQALETEQARLGRLNGLTQAILLAAAQAALILMLVLAAPLVRAHALPAADAVMAALAALAAFEAAAPLPAALQALGALWEAAGRVFALADGGGTGAEAPEDGHAEDGDQTVPAAAALAVRALGFAYQGAPPLLRDLSFTLPAGGTLALTGPVGAGKSTLALLLTGLLTPSSGEIRVNGRPAAALAPETLRRHFAVAPQHADLFSGTLRQILHLGAPEADDHSLRRVLEQVGLAETVAAFPQGLDTWIGNGGLTLSGGQARRLAVARALLRPAPILILDEPGEGLDYDGERALLNAVLDGLNGRSLILITHRAAGLERMDTLLEINA